jgi:hypothetical protein
MEKTRSQSSHQSCWPLRRRLQRRSTTDVTASRVTETTTLTVHGRMSWASKPGSPGSTESCEETMSTVFRQSGKDAGTDRSREAGEDQALYCTKCFGQ